MSKMKSTLAATVLTLVLAVPTFAGVIQTPGGTPPPPPPPTTEEEGGTPGTPSSQSAQALNSDLSSEMLIDILIAVLSLF
ncbi:MAG: hypothetical protein ND895_24635 [Pyrinomonadaceae bacterium]|nr:hypothetical protein [Pyrinomonadaceae bacterium]